jgi:glutamine cyclotransferase
MLVVMLVVCRGILLVTLVRDSSRDLRRTAAPELKYRVIQVFPHDTGAFTQGLLFTDGHVYESTGLKGESSVRRVHLETGRILQKYDLPNTYFGEGLASVGDKLLQLTFDTEIGFVYDRKSLHLRRTFSYKGEAWGLTFDGHHLIMSDGTATLRFLDVDTYAEVSRITITDGDKPVTSLNELEYVDGSLLANVFRTDSLVRIEPNRGKVTAWINLAGLRTEEERERPTVPVKGERYQTKVLNGIAYDTERRRLFVTGKRWSKLFQIEIANAK